MGVVFYGVQERDGFFGEGQGAGVGGEAGAFSGVLVFLGEVQEYVGEAAAGAGISEVFGVEELAEAFPVGVVIQVFLQFVGEVRGDVCVFLIAVLGLHQKAVVDEEGKILL